MQDPETVSFRVVASEALQSRGCPGSLRVARDDTARCKIQMPYLFMSLRA